jgi:DNA topoisomerase-1
MRYNEASLIDKISPKHLNIGRPSTNAYIINKIQTQKYVEIQNIKGKNYTATNYNIVSTDKKIINVNNKNLIVGEEKNKFVPTNIGIKVVEFLNNHFIDLMDYNFTAKMEKNLDRIALGKINGITIIKPFYEYLTEQIKLIKITVPQNIKTNNIIGNYNNSDIILKDGKFGKFIIYDNKNYNLSKIKSLPENKIEFLNEIIELIKNPIQENYLKKLENKTNNYLIKKGEFGFYVQEINIKTKKTKNYNFDFVIKKIALDNDLNVDTQINDIMEKIKLKNIIEQITYLKSK